MRSGSLNLKSTGPLMRFLPMTKTRITADLTHINKKKPELSNKEAVDKVLKN